MTLPTVCVGEGLTWRHLKPEHVGVPYSPEGLMNREHFEVGSTKPSKAAAHSQAAKQHTAKQSCLALVSALSTHSRLCLLAGVQAACRDEPRGTRGRLYHALKW